VEQDRSQCVAQQEILEDVESFVVEELYLWLETGWFKVVVDDREGLENFIGTLEWQRLSLDTVVIRVIQDEVWGNSMTGLIRDMAGLLGVELALNLSGHDERKAVLR
jgi:hypothetical protein